MPLDGRTQRTTMATILRHATAAKNRVFSTQRLVARQVGQTFMADSYASQAEKTLSKYSSSLLSSTTTTPTRPSPMKPSTTGTPSLGEGQTCHGCGSPSYPFSQCPQRNHPKIKAIARKNYDKLRKSRCLDDSGGARKHWATKNPNLDDLSPAARQNIIKCSRQMPSLPEIMTTEALLTPLSLVLHPPLGTYLLVVVAQALAAVSFPTLLPLLLETKRSCPFPLPAF
jgi:hypothetical protein